MKIIRVWCIVVVFVIGAVAAYGGDITVEGDLTVESNVVVQEDMTVNNNIHCSGSITSSSVTSSGEITADSFHNANNSVSGFGSSVIGGEGNLLNSFYGTIAGGYCNIATQSPGFAFIGGGSLNTIRASSGAVICGGIANNAKGNCTFIGGGNKNEILDCHYSAISGGFSNRVNGNSSMIGGGFCNLVTGECSVIQGGYSNRVIADYSMVLGGRVNSATGNNSCAAGSYAEALHDGAFVWSDSRSDAFQSVANDEFAVNAQGGVRFVTTNDEAVTIQDGVVAAGSFGFIDDGGEAGNIVTSWNHVVEQAGPIDAASVDGMSSADIRSVGEQYYYQPVFSNGITTFEPVLRREGMVQWLDDLGEDIQLAESHCATFDGTTNAVVVAHSNVFDFAANDVSFTMWMKAPSTAKQDYRTLFSKYNNSTGWYILADSNGRIVVGGSLTNELIGTIDVLDNDWHHIAVVRDSGMSRLYIDGVEDMATNTLSGDYDCTNNVMIGGMESEDYFWEGQMADVRIYSSALSSGQVALVALGSLSVDESSVIAWWPFAEGADVTLYDVSGNDCHGALSPINGLDSSAFWANTQDVFHYNILKGFTLGIVSDGLDDYIDTGIVPNEDTGVEVLIKPNYTYDYSSWRQFFGVKQTDPEGFNFYISYATWMDTWLYGWGDTRNHSPYPYCVSSEYDLLGWFKALNFRYSTNGFYINEVKRGNVTGSWTITNDWSFFLFAFNDNNIDVAAECCIEMFYCKVWQNGVLARDYIPIAEGQKKGTQQATTLALYDTVSDQVFYNDASGDFTAVYVPALADGSADANGYPVTHPAGDGHNGAESKLLQSTNNLTLIDADTDHFWYDTYGEPVAVSYSDLMTVNSTRIFVDTSSSGLAQSIRTYDEDLEGEELEQAQNYAETADGDQMVLYAEDGYIFNGGPMCGDGGGITNLNELDPVFESYGFTTNHVNMLNNLTNEIMKIYQSAPLQGDLSMGVFQ